MSTQTSNFSSLKGQQFINLITYRKNGEEMITPVWFAERDGKLYVMTTAAAGKVKRIRNNGSVKIGPSDQRGNPLGPTMPATARVLPESETAVAKAALDAKYGLMKAAFDFFMTVRGTQRAWIEISN